MPNAVTSGTMPGTTKTIPLKRFLKKKQMYNRAHTPWKKNEKLYIKELVPESDMPELVRNWQILTAADPVGQANCIQRLFVPREDGGYDEYDARGNHVN